MVAVPATRHCPRCHSKNSVQLGACLACGFEGTTLGRMRSECGHCGWRSSNPQGQYRADASCPKCGALPYD